MKTIYKSFTIIAIIIIVTIKCYSQQCTTCSGTTVTGITPSAIGTNTKATANYSFAAGYGSEATQQTAIALGHFAKANGIRSISIGENCVSNSQGYSFGQNAKALGSQSLAIGRFVETDISGMYSIVIGSGTDQCILKNGIGSSLMVGFNSTVPTLFVGSSTTYPASFNGVGNVGIGTSDPKQRFHVNGNVLLTGMNSSLLFADTPPANGGWGKWGIEYDASDIANSGLNFWQPFNPGKSENGNSNQKTIAGGNYVLFLKDNGNIGIGTNSPQAKLHIEGTTQVSGELGIGEEKNPASLNLFGPANVNGTLQVANALFVGDPKTAASAVVYGPTVLNGTLRVSSLQSGANSMIVSDKEGNLGIAPIPIGDQMGSHIATRNIQMSGKFITNDEATGTSEGLFVSPSGSVGVKTNNLLASDDFTVFSPITKAETFLRVRSEASKPAVVWATAGSKSIGLGVVNGKGYIYDDNIQTKIITFQGGRVGIGIPEGMDIPTTHKLYVTGGISAEEVKVRLKESWSDYVFKPDYSLLPINELEKYILNNCHLPDVPSEVDVKENGIDIGSMNAVLLKKIEELTLYIIQQEKRIAALEKSENN